MLLIFDRSAEVVVERQGIDRLVVESGIGCGKILAVVDWILG